MGGPPVQPRAEPSHVAGVAGYFWHIDDFSPLKRFADIQAFQHAQLIKIRVHQICQMQQDLLALAGKHASPALVVECSAGGGNGSLGVSDRGGRNRTHRLARRRFVHVQTRSAGCVAPFAADQISVGPRREFARCFRNARCFQISHKIEHAAPLISCHASAEERRTRHIPGWPWTSSRVSNSLD